MARRIVVSALLVLAGATGCKTPGELSGWPSTLTIRSPAQQSGLIGYAVNTPPSVQLLDADGHPIAGANVTFRITTGAGSLTGAAATTGPDGVATVGSWVAGAGLTQVTAEIPAPFRVAPVVFTTNGLAPDFDINLLFLTPAAVAHQAVFQNAAQKWQRIVYGDLPDILVAIPAGVCLGNEPPVNGIIDDVIIFVTLDSIDGPGGVLAGSVPCFIRTFDKLPLYGVMVFDTADIAALDSVNGLEDVVTHEMGHVLGFGTLWDPTLFDYLVGPTSSGGTDPHFVGPHALAAFDRIGGASYTGGGKVPVENQGGQGTVDGHWRESVFDTELMTGYFNPSVPNPLSIVTVASLEDEGYLVNYAGADPYIHTFSERLGAPSLGGGARRIPLGNDVLHLPMYLVDDRGRITGRYQR